MISPPPHDIVRAVRSELAWPGRYHLHPSVVAQRSWFEQLFGWLYDRWQDFEQALSSRIKLGPVGATILGDLLILAAVALVAVVAAQLLMTLQAERAQRAEAVEIGSARNAHLLARAATDAAGRGDYMRAIRLLFAAAVTLLDLRGVVRDDASATVNELRRALRARNAQADEPFVAIARAYTSAAYAEERLDERAWVDASRAYGELVQRVNESR